MTSGRLCQSFVSANSPSAPVAVLDSPSVDDNDLNESLIPTWDDADDIIRQIFDDDADSSRGDGDGDDWENESSCEEEEEEEVPPWLRKHGPMLPFARNKLPVISSDESDEDDDNDEDRDSSSDGEDSNAENIRKQSFPRSKHRRGKSHDSQFRFALPKHLLHKSTNPTMDAESLKPVQVELSKAVRIPVHGELIIRADVLQRNHVDGALDLIRRFGYPTRRLVVEEVHQGTAVEALLIYLLEVTRDNGAHPMHLRYTGSWMSPTLISYLASDSAKGVVELELGLSLYPKTRSCNRRSTKKAPNRNISRHLQRLEELEEAVAANQSLRVIRLLPSCHAKVSEGIIWAASCHPHLERIVVSVPVRAPQNTMDVHESGILLLEGLSEVIQQSATLTDLSLRVDPDLCLLRKNSHEPPAAKHWQSLADALAVTNSLCRLRLEFEECVDEAPSEVLADMSSALMEGISRNASLQSLELVNVPEESALDLFHGVHSRREVLPKISLTNSPAIVSYLSVLEDDVPQERPGGWLVVSSLQVDKASLTDDLFGLKLLSQAGGLEAFKVTDNMSEKKANSLLGALLGGGSKIECLTMGHDSPFLLSLLKSESLLSLELNGGHHTVTADAALTLLEACPSLRHLQFTNVKWRKEGHVCGKRWKITVWNASNSLEKNK